MGRGKGASGQKNDRVPKPSRGRAQNVRPRPRPPIGAPEGRTEGEAQKVADGRGGQGEQKDPRQDEGVTAASFFSFFRSAIRGLHLQGRA